MKDTVNKSLKLEKPLILTGFMGSGKSSVGKILAERLGRRFIDLDTEIVAASGCSINDIFARAGQESFRILESSHLKKVLLSGQNLVISTGGGAVISKENRALMHSIGIIINLKVTVEQVMSRLKGCSDRPLLSGEDAVDHAEILLKQREQFYSAADIRIDTNGKSVEDVAAVIQCCLEGFSE